MDLIKEEKKKYMSLTYPLRYRYDMRQHALQIPFSSWGQPQGPMSPFGVSTTKKLHIMNVLVILLCLSLIVILIFKLLPLASVDDNPTDANVKHSNSKPLQLETMGFDESTLLAELCVITFRVQTYGMEEQKARLDFLKTLHIIEIQCNEREIPFQLLPKTPQPFIFIQNSTHANEWYEWYERYEWYDPTFKHQFT